MSTLATSEVLDLAADALQTAEWQQYFGWGNENMGDALCLEGAIIAAQGAVTGEPSHFANTCPAGLAVREYLDMTVEYTQLDWMPGDPDGPRYSWNDRQGRIKDEVIEVLRAAAAVERAREAVASGAQSLLFDMAAVA